MPTYEYACSACGHRLEVFQTFSEDPLVECQECGGALRRVFHPVGILFKGSGFYSTDARKASTRGNGSTQDSDSKKKSSDKRSSGSTEAGSSGSSEAGSGSSEKSKSAPGTTASKSEAKGSGTSKTKDSKDS